MGEKAPAVFATPEGMTEPKNAARLREVITPQPLAHLARAAVLFVGCVNDDAE